MNDVPDNHPRATSLRIRNRVVRGIELGVTSTHGLIAHGRGEAFDYLLGEKTHLFALDAIAAAAALLKHASHPVLSINGNVCAIATQEMVALSQLIPAPIEINLFHASKEREQKIRKYLLSTGAIHVLVPGEVVLPFLGSNRRFVNSEGIALADVVFVPLEDGDRCEALINAGKKVIAVDLNPLSRTAQMATICIVDNIVRALPLLIKELQKKEGGGGLPIFDNRRVLSQAIAAVRSGM